MKWRWCLNFWGGCKHRGPPHPAPPAETARLGHLYDDCGGFSSRFGVWSHIPIRGNVKSAVGWFKFCVGNFIVTNNFIKHLLRCCCGDRVNGVACCRPAKAAIHLHSGCPISHYGTVRDRAITIPSIGTICPRCLEPRRLIWLTRAGFPCPVRPPGSSCRDLPSPALVTDAPKYSLDPLLLDQFTLFLLKSYTAPSLFARSGQEPPQGPLGPIKNLFQEFESCYTRSLVVSLI